MADQTQVTARNRRPASPARAAAPSVGGVARDLAALAELQFKLLHAEAREGAPQAVVCGVLLAAAITLVAGSAPVALTGAAFWLTQTMRLSLAAAFAWTALAGVVAAALIAGVAWQLWRRSPWTFVRTRRELARNVKWIGKVLRGEGDLDSTGGSRDV
jgi:hypothetical protein